MLIARFSFLQYRLQAHPQHHPNIELIMHITFYHQFNQSLQPASAQHQIFNRRSLNQPTEQITTLAPHEMPSLQSFLLKRPDALSRHERQALSRCLRKQLLVDSLGQQAKPLKFKTTDLILSSPSR